MKPLGLVSSTHSISIFFSLFKANPAAIWCVRQATSAAPMSALLLVTLFFMCQYYVLSHFLPAFKFFSTMLTLKLSLFPMRTNVLFQIQIRLKQFVANFTVHKFSCDSFLNISVNLKRPPPTLASQTRGPVPENWFLCIIDKFSPYDKMVPLGTNIKAK